MVAPVTKTEIVNAAAALLGSTERISSIESGGNLASHAKALWDPTIRMLLADHPWNFAIRRAALNAGPAPAFGYERTFALPADCLRVLPPREADGCEVFYDGEVENGAILTDAEAPLRIRYISSDPIDTCRKWPPHFVLAAEYALAMGLAEPLTGAANVSQKFIERSEHALARAKRLDGLETQARRRAQLATDGSWLRAMRTMFYPYG